MLPRAARASWLSAVLLAIAVPGLAGTITSTPAGGLWTDPATWVGGSVPGGSDDVVIAGPVVLPSTHACASLAVLEAGGLAPQVGPARLDVAGPVVNDGAISGEFALTLSVGGDLTHGGTWLAGEIIFTGTSDRRLVTSADLDTDLTMDAAAAGDILVDTPLRTTADIELGEGRMVLGPDCPLTLGESRFQGALSANGNEVRFESWSYLDLATVQDAILVGTVSLAHNIHFVGTVTIMDLLQNQVSAGGTFVTVDGNLINNGEVEQHQYSFIFQLTGNLENNGPFEASYVSMEGPDPHVLRMGPDGLMHALILLPEFEEGLLIAETDVQLDDGISLGFFGAMTLAPESLVHMTQSGGISGLVLEGNGSTIEGEGGLLSVGTIDDIRIAGAVELLGSTTFTSGLTVSGIVETRLGNPADARVEGTLVNDGEIRDGGALLDLIVTGDLLNGGTMTNGRVTLAGDSDQLVEIGTGIGVPEFVLDSGLEGSNHQWYRDGGAMPGETLPTLTFATLGDADQGVYHCEADGSTMSRLFTVAPATVGVPPIALATTTLAPVRPNPFRPTAEVRFTLSEPSRAYLAVYDVAGRRVAVLVDGRLGAGSHVTTWDSDTAAAGVYFFRLTAGETDVRRKAIRLD